MAPSRVTQRHTIIRKLYSGFQLANPSRISIFRIDSVEIDDTCKDGQAVKKDDVDETNL